MQFADGPIAFASGAALLRNKYSPNPESGAPGDSERLSYLEELAAAPQLAHFMRPARCVRAAHAPPWDTSACVIHFHWRLC